MAQEPEPHKRSLDVARARVTNLLNHLGVERVILVDDQAEPQMARVVTAFVDQPRALRIEGLTDPPKEPGAEGIRAWLDDNEAELTVDRKRELFRRAQAKLATIGSPDVDDDDAMAQLDVLANLVGKKLIELTPSEWGDGSEILAEGPGQDETLVLFDLDLGGGNTEGGLQLLKELRETHAGVRTAVITSHITAQEEFDQQAKYAEQTGVPRDELILASKEHLTAETCMSFVELLRVTANARNLRDLRDAVTEGIKDDLDRAIKELEDFDPRVLEDVIFRASHEEGAYEGDTLVRVIGILQARFARASQLEPESRVPGIIEKIRGLVAEPAELNEYPGSAQRAGELMAGEAYVPERYINELGLPLSNGDIFEVDGAHYLLVAQACDLVVRSDGTRSRESATLTLLPIGATTTGRSRDDGVDVAAGRNACEPDSQATPANTGNPQDPERDCAGPDEAASKPSEKEKNRSADDDEEGRAGWKLPLGHDLGPERTHAFFKPTHEVPVVVLDLCAADSNGRARLPRERTAEPSPITPGVRSLRTRRVEAIEAKASELRKVLAALPDEGADTARSIAIAGVLNMGDLVTASWEPDEHTVVAFNCRRVTRLTERYADAALSAYTVHQARAAFEHDLGAFRKSRRA
jgi:hypothetical protein